MPKIYADRRYDEQFAKSDVAMTEALTATQMRAIETAAIASGEVTGLELMERAGRGVVQAMFAEWPELAAGPFRAVVLCGPGNNGGDGFVVARLLAEWGWAVEVFFSGQAGRLPPDARTNHDRWAKMGTVTRLTPQTWQDGALAGLVDVVIDALFGIGLSRPIDLPRCALPPIRDEITHHPKIIAVDVPSGLCANSGRQIGTCAKADLTVTFHAVKPGHYLAEGPDLCGKIRIVDLGLRPADPSDQISPGILRLAGAGLGQVGKRGGHKFAYGHALILSGPPGRGGAARLAARGALRIGAGVVTMGCEAAAIAEHAARLDAVMIREVAGAEGLSVVLTDARINALCLGPGMGISDESRSLLAMALKSARSCCLDADALTLIARDASLFAMLHPTCVLTPHAGEFARLFPDIAAQMAAPAVMGPAFSKVDAARAAARRAGCVVLYKGVDTVIADPSGRCSINLAQYDRCAPWLATAGSGDVLSPGCWRGVSRRCWPRKPRPGCMWTVRAALGRG